MPHPVVREIVQNILVGDAECVLEELINQPRQRILPKNGVVIGEGALLESRMFSLHCEIELLTCVNDRIYGNCRLSREPHASRVHATYIQS